MRAVHLAAHHVAHAEDRAHGKDADRNAQHGEQRAGLVVPQVEPDLVPDDAHFR